MRRSGLIVCAVFGALVAFGREAKAADHAHGARWVVDVRADRDAACASERASFEREVGLACAAMGTCQVVDDAKNAELRATLVCTSQDAWRLELHTVEGMLVSSTDLDGPREDRLREAAMEVARDQAPERTLAAASLRNTLGEGDKVKKPWKMPKMVFAFAGTGSAGGIERYAGGVRGLFGLQIAKSAHVTLGMAGLMGGRDSEAARHFRTGLGMSLGAPFDGSIVGLVFEGGLAIQETYETDTGMRSTKPVGKSGAYGQAGFVLALPFREVRPYAAIVGGAQSELKSVVYASADIGIAFPLN